MSGWVMYLAVFLAGVFLSGAVKGVLGGAKSKVSGG